MKLTTLEVITAAQTEDEDQATISDLIYQKYLMLKNKNPEWSDYRCKLNLKKLLNVTIRQINDVPFFHKQLLAKWKRDKLNRKIPNNTFLTMESQKKITDSLHYDRNNIITKEIISGGSRRDLYPAESRGLQVAKSVYYRAGRSFTNV